VLNSCCWLPACASKRCVVVCALRSFYEKLSMGSCWLRSEAVKLLVTNNLVHLKFDDRQMLEF
jgi:hypothetical protein